MDRVVFDRILEAQKNEITEYYIYQKLSNKIKDPHNSHILEQISQDELRHHNIWKAYTQQEVQPKRFKIWFFYIIARVFGLSFSIKLMEQGEEAAQVNYDDLAKSIPDAQQISSDEDLHEAQLMEMINEERFHYVGAIIRGLNEAVVETLAILTGLSLILVETTVIAMTGIITGAAMSLSLGATEYLATKAEESHLKPGKSALYTGFATATTVTLLISPYLFLPNTYVAMGAMIAIALVIIFFFNYYIAVARNISFWKRFAEMVIIATLIASFTYLIGYLASEVWHISIH
ncbi:MAG: rubrerythrin family protein [Dehalococcoidales bacterium]|nr:rubrerythrin family protein [Dehalococcoidales bacterium]